MNKGDYFLKQYRDYLFSGFTYGSDFNGIILCEDGCAIIDCDIVKPENIFKPKETNKRKRYKPNDKVYVVEGRNFEYGVIHAETPNAYIIDVDGLSVYSKEAFIIPTNWWLLENNCKRSIYILGICLKRMGIYKDLRILICKHVWATKNDAEWGIFKK
jgi:hypothetical protein